MLAKIGEVIQSSTSEFLAECYQLHGPPPLGSLVTTIEGTVEVYGVVCNAATESIEPGRRPIARGREETMAEDIYRSNPQLARLLRTTFMVLIIGHSEEGHLCHYLPPRPPRVHSFVYPCDRDQMRRFTQSLDFLSILLSGNVAGSRDEVISACLRQASRSHDDERAFLVRAGKELALLLGGELNRLNAILKRLRPSPNSH